MNYPLVEATGMGEAAGLAAEFLPLPHLTPTLWPSMSIPFAQASAARSAESRSLKLTNAHLYFSEFPGILNFLALANTHFDFATCTTDLSLSGFMEGSDLMTVVRNDCSVASAGKDDRNSDI